MQERLSRQLIHTVLFTLTFVACSNDRATMADRSYGQSLPKSESAMRLESLATELARFDGSLVGTTQSCLAEPEWGGGIQTRCTVQVERVLHGSVLEGSVEVMYEGGCLDGVCIRASHGPELRAGARVALAYRARPDAGLIAYSTIGLPDHGDKIVPGISLSDLAPRVEALATEEYR